jgi:hypothetical protein
MAIIPEIVPNEAPAAPPLDPEPTNDPLAIAIARLRNRTPEQVAADRDRLLALSPPPRPLPHGKTLEDVLAGLWPGDETDEQVREALEKLS